MDEVKMDEVKNNEEKEEQEVSDKGKWQVYSQIKEIFYCYMILLSSFECTSLL